MPTLTLENTRDSRSLAVALGWAEAESKSVEVQLGDTVLETTRTFIAGESAATFSKVQHQNGYDPSDTAALYGYHTSAQWSIVADDFGIQVVNPHWAAEGSWYKLPHVGWEDVERNDDLWRALSPEGLVRRLPQKAATRRREPTNFLKPVDDALVERLDKWRDQALAYSSGTEQIDNLLQTYYAQLFVLRTIEDRHLDHAIPAVRDLIKSGDDFDRVGWAIVLRTSQDRIGSDLFNVDVTTEIPDHVLAGVIRDLYEPFTIPTRVRTH